MKNIRRLESDEFEKFRVQSFEQISVIKKNIAMLTNELKRYIEIKDNIDLKIDTLKSDYNERMLIHIGKGKYYPVVVKPIEIEERISELQNSVYNNYTDEIDKENAKKYELQNQTLTEDLKNSKEELEKFLAETDKIEKELSLTLKSRKLIVKAIRSIEIQIINSEKMADQKMSRIKKLDRLQEKRIPVFVKRYITETKK